MTIGHLASDDEARRMNYTAKEVLDQIAAGEDSRWEFKQVGFAGRKLRSPKRDVLADEIAALREREGWGPGLRRQRRRTGARPFGR